MRLVQANCYDNGSMRVNLSKRHLQKLFTCISSSKVDDPVLNGGTGVEECCPVLNVVRSKVQPSGCTERLCGEMMYMIWADLKLPDHFKMVWTDL